MTPERYQRLCELFDRAQARPPDRRAAFLDELGAIDPTLAAELRGMLADDQRAQGERLLQAPLPVNAKALLPDQQPTVVQAPAAGADPDEEPPAVDGYRLDGGRLGAGGMGVVWLGRDTRLHRAVAVKVLRHALRGHAQLERRFVEEAQVQSQLAHPAIPPVHELGALADGRPYFVMKLVKGRTLADLLQQGAGPADLPRLLGVFEQACQGVAYAHSKRVIHRDLKPANVMVGAFGEVQLMDWGLAKVLRRGDGAGAASQPPAGPSVVRTVRSGSDTSGEWGSWTQAGSVLGTPAYMAPEQARGEVDALDERADVFGLGAILCHVLTGQPPFAGSTEGAMARARAGAVADALLRLDGCGADAELLALAKGCLAPEPSGRPADGAAVAAAVAAYLESVRERLRRAELERAAAEARAAEEARTRAVAEAKAAVERRARRLTAGLAAAGLLLAAALGGGAWWAREQRRATDDGVGRLLGAADLLREQARREPLAQAQKLDEALATAGQARRLADEGGASADVRQRAADLVGELTLAADAAQRDRDLLAALLEVREPRERPQDAEAPELAPALAEPSADEQFAAAFRAWDPTFEIDRLPIEEAAARLRERPAAVVTEVVAALDEWAGERRRRRLPEAQWRRLADLAAALDESDGTRRELRAILARGGLAREQALGVLAAALRPVPVPFDAGPGEDRARLRQLAAAADPAAEPVLGLLALARALRDAGEDAPAERLLRAALRHRPREVVFYFTLGQLLEAQRRDAEALECYVAARALRPELGVVLANALVRRGREQEGLALLGRLAAERPRDAWLHYARGNTLDDTGHPREAEAAYREALGLAPKFAAAHLNLGVVLMKQGRRQAEAEAEYHTALKLAPNYLEAHFNLGNCLIAQHRYEDAAAQYRAAIHLRNDHINSYLNLSSCLAALGHRDEAEAVLREVVQLKPDYAEAHYNLGNLLRKLGRFREAAGSYRDAIRLRPDYYQAHFNLGLALTGLSRPGEAEPAFRDVLRIQPDNAGALCCLGESLQEQGRFAEALPLLRRGHELGSPAPGWTLPSLQMIAICERLLEQDRRLAVVANGEDESATAAERLGLASFCQRSSKRLHRTAACLAAAAFAAEPRLAAGLSEPHRYNAACSAALAAAGRAEDTKHLPDKERLMLRHQALAWLRADLALHASRAARDGPRARGATRETLEHWQKDADLAPVRDGDALDRLPGDERQDWGRLWDEVRGLLRKVEVRE